MQIRHDRRRFFSSFSIVLLKHPTKVAKGIKSLRQGFNDIREWILELVKHSHRVQGLPPGELRKRRDIGGQAHEVFGQLGDIRVIFGVNVGMRRDDSVVIGLGKAPESDRNDAFLEIQHFEEFLGDVLTTVAILQG